MLRCSLIVCVLLLTLHVRATQGQEKDSAPAAESKVALNDQLAVLSPWVGTWEIDGAWNSGQPIWARNEYTVGMGGNYLEARTYTKDESGKVYQRYLTIWRWDAESESIVSHGFTFDGTYDSLTPTVKVADGKASVTSEWTPKGSPAAIRQTVKIIDENSYSWKVWSVNDGEVSEMLDGVWKRK